MASGQLITDYIATSPGPPSGAPSLFAGSQAGLAVDTVNSRLYFWNPSTLGWNPATGGNVNSVSGTAHQVIASPTTGAVVLSTPQSIDTTSQVTFAQVTLGGQVGASVSCRLIGAVNGAAPASGSWLAGDIAPDVTGGMWMCTSAGTPGTWVKIAGGIPTLSYGSTNLTASSGSIANGSWTIITTVNLTAGTWMIGGAITFFRTTASGIYSAMIQVGANPLTTGNAAPSTNASIGLPVYPVVLGATTAVQLMGQGAATSVSWTGGGNAPVSSANATYLSYFRVA